MGNDFESVKYVEVVEDGRKGRGPLLASGRGAVMALGLALVMAVAAVSATLTDAMTTTNTYSFGNVSINLADASGHVDPITPNGTVTRISEITNTGSMPAYVFLRVTMPRDAKGNVFSPPEPGDGWVDITSSTKYSHSLNTRVFAYYGDGSALKELAGGSAVQQASEVVYQRSDATHDPVDVDVTAYAVQTTDVNKLNSSDEATTTADFWELVENISVRNPSQQAK